MMADSAALGRHRGMAILNSGDSTLCWATSKTVCKALTVTSAASRYRAGAFRYRCNRRLGLAVMLPRLGKAAARTPHAASPAQTG